MYGAVYAGIIKGIKKRKLPLWSGTVVLAALGANIIQNLFVFDNLNTYLLFFAFLAYGSFLITESDDEPEKAMRSARNSYTRAHGMSIACAAVLLVLAYYFHVAPMQQSKALIRALIAYQEHVPMEQQINAFKEALSYNSFGTTEVHEQIMNFARNVLGNQRYSNAEQSQYITFAVCEMRKEINTPAKDVKHMVFLGSLLDQILASDPSYPMEAKSILEEAVRLSPTKQMIAFELAQYYVTVGQNDAARDLLYREWKLDPTYHVAGVHTWVLAIATNRSDIANEVAALYPPASLSESDLVRLGETYRRVKDFKGALIMYEQLVAIVPDNAKYHATYAALLASAGRTAEARKQAEEMAHINRPTQEMMRSGAQGEGDN